MQKQVLFLNFRYYYKLITLFTLCILIMIVYQSAILSGVVKLRLSSSKYQPYIEEMQANRIIVRHDLSVKEYYDKRKDWRTSYLGAVLFKNKIAPPPRNETFIVLVWKYWDWLKKRHAHSFDNKRENILEDCPVKNCIFTGDSMEMHKADAVVVHIQHGEVPQISNRNYEQRWVFLSDESPKNSFSMATLQPNLKDWDGVFNWSMTYRTDADVPVPYGRTVPLHSSSVLNTMSEPISTLVPFWKSKRKDVLVTILISNCNVPERMKYLHDLQKHVTVDVYGQCSDKFKDRCPGHFRSDCVAINDYLFYLVFENSQCHQYLSEKIFHNAYAKGAIPIILGPPKEDCEKLLPPDSFLHLSDFETPEELANTLDNISKDEDLLLHYHKWRNYFEVVNEHGYLSTKSFHFCRICEALNYNSEDNKSYSLVDLENFFDRNKLCKI